MPLDHKYTPEVHPYCASLDGWEIGVPSKTNPAHNYTVRFERLTPLEQTNQGTIFGFTCNCKGFQYHFKCSHIELAKPHFCGWDGFISGLEPIEVEEIVNNEKVVRKLCPRCKRREVRYRAHAV